MFASLLGSRKDPRSETTPLLQALNSYRARQTADNNESASNQDADEEYRAGVAGQYGDDAEDEDNDGGRDGPLLPVFSSEFLGRLVAPVDLRPLC
jgi:hypothetical protein